MREDGSKLWVQVGLSFAYRISVLPAKATARR